MSAEAVKQFLKKAESTPELQRKLQAVPKGGGQTSVAEIVKLAAAHGFEFTTTDYETAVDDMLTEKHAAGGLSDSELALISGGLMCISSDGTNCRCCLVQKPSDPSTH